MICPSCGVDNTKTTVDEKGIRTSCLECGEPFCYLDSDGCYCSEAAQTAALAESMREWLRTLTREKAQVFLAQLTMYDEYGQLKNE